MFHWYNVVENIVLCIACNTNNFISLVELVSKLEISVDRFLSDLYLF